MSQELHLRALPNVEFVHGFPGIPASPERPQASIRGFLEVRIGSQPVKAKWVKVELRKIETIPSGKAAEEFIDVIGQGPITLWEAQNEQDLLSSNDFPFNIRIPETIPPSVALEKGYGIKYELCASMSLIKRKKFLRGLFRREAKTTVATAVPIVIDKHELHSTWPIYGQHDSRQVSREDGLILIVDRGNTCFAPGDPLAIIATIKSENLRPVVVRSLELTLEEWITFHGGSQGLGKKNVANMNMVNNIGEHKLPLSYTLYGGTQQRVELAVNIPPNHTTTSVTTGRHLDIVYKIRVKCFLDNAPTIEIDLPLTMTNWPRHVSAELTRRIGIAPNLTSRGPISQAVQPTPSSQEVSGNTQPVPPVPPKTVTSKILSPVNGSSTALASPGPAIALSPAAPAQVLSPVNLDRNQSAHGSSHEGTVSELAGPQAHADEFGHRQGDFTAATAPARIGQRPLSASDSDGKRSDHHGDGSLSGGSLNRRTRSATGGTNRLKVYNPDNNIPEEPSPNTAGVKQPPSLHRWPTAEAEKERLYQDAQARVAQVQNVAFDSPHLNGDTSHTVNGSREALRPASPRTNHNAWVTAENEKQRLYELAQARVREIQGQAVTPPATADPTEAPGSNLQNRPEFRRPQADTQSQVTVRPTRSAGAALYSRAIEQINRSSSIPAPPPPSHMSEPRRNASFAANNRPVGDDKSALLYYQAQQQVQRHLHQHGEAANQEEGPIPYDQLFGGDAVASSSHGHPPPTTALSEKELLRRRHEQQDAMAMAAQNNIERPLSSAQQNSRTSSIRVPNSVTSPTAPLSEKEIMRRAFEARDAALRAAGQVPPPILPDYNTPSNGNSITGPLSATEEKRQLAERYGVDNEKISNRPTPPPPMPSPPLPPPPQVANLTETIDVVAPTPTDERSLHSEIGGRTETFLRRDPSVSAGKRRQINTAREPSPPPPLPPRPPQEYIEETKREDHRTTLRNALPLDFSASFDLGFDHFGKDGQTSDAHAT